MLKKKNFLRIVLLLAVTAVVLVNCKQDEGFDLQVNRGTQEDRYEKKIVNSNDIPKIMGFVNQISKGSNSFIVDDNGREDRQTRSPEENIIVGNIINEYIVSITDQNQKTNYAFKLTKEVQSAPYFLNLIINETFDGYYAYIIKYEYDTDWYNQQNGEIDLTNYKGKIIYYKSDGTYVSKYDINNGEVSNFEFRHPCIATGGDGNNSNDDTTGDGNNSNTGNNNNNGDTSGNDNNGDTGSDSNGSGGSSLEYEFIYRCDNSTYDGFPFLCAYYGYSGHWEITILGFDSKTYSLKSFLRHPCNDDIPHDCFDNNGDPISCNSIDENPIEPINIIAVNLELISQLYALTNQHLTFEQNQWVSDPNNLTIVNEVIAFLEENSNSQNVYLNIINILTNNNLTLEQQLNNIINELDNFYPLLEPNLNQDLYATEVLRLANWIKVHGELPLGNYIESLVPDFPNMTHGDVYDIYLLAREMQFKIQTHIFLSVLTVIAEAAIPFIEFAVIDATLGAALPLLSKIPLSFVTRGARLEAMVSEAGLLGVQGSGNSIRIITTTSPIAKAEELFATLTKDAITIVTDTNGALVANMGNGNFITFRTIAQSSSNFPATISMNFSGIWSNVRHLKFQ